MMKPIRLESIRSRPRFLGSYLILGFWTVLVLAPLYVMVINSFKPQMEIFASPFGWPKKWNFTGYVALWKAGNFGRYFLNSLMITVSSIAGTVLLGTLAAYGLVNWRTRASHLLSLLFIAGMMIPIRIASINLLQIMKFLGLLDKLGSLLPIYVAMGMPMAVLILSEYLRTIPKELTQAAHMDGAGSLLIFWRIILPLARPALATVAIFNLVNIWNDLWFPLIFIRAEDQRTLMLGVTRLFGQYQTDWTKVLATLTMATIPILLLYLAMSKQFIKGLTAGAVKE
ncbi:MAG: carbohydrate ABC transporter permease [Spirochaetota bacterium]